MMFPLSFTSPNFPSFFIMILFSCPSNPEISSYSSGNTSFPVRSINPYFPLFSTFKMFFSYHTLLFLSMFSIGSIWSYSVSISSFFSFIAFVLYVPLFSSTSYVQINTSFSLFGITIISWYDGCITSSPSWFITPHLFCEYSTKYW